MSLVDFTVTDQKAGAVLASDCIGSDAMRWFLLWENSTRLWGYGSDIGYFKIFEFSPDGKVSENDVIPGTPIPVSVRDRLPTSLHSRFPKVSVSHEN